jgi:hypothetical protein
VRAVLPYSRSLDVVFSISLLAHLLENYLRETFRLLKAGGTMMYSHFNMEHLPPTFGTRHTFQHKLGNARIESEMQSENAVAYHTELFVSPLPAGRIFVMREGQTMSSKQPTNRR